MHYERTTLANGLRIISQDMPSLRSLAIGVWVDTGSRDETPVEAGASHFLEHLLFKGSAKWPAQRISEAFDAMGARHNAFTSKEYTAYWARMRDVDLATGMEILAEMVQRPAFRQEEIDLERGVVLEEINMNEDDPPDVAHEQFVTTLWGSHPLAPPILGAKDSITGMTRDTVHGYWARRYTPHSCVIAVAGRVEHDDLVALVEQHWETWQGGVIDRPLTTPDYESGVGVVRRDTEQAHLVFGGPGLKRNDERRFALVVADHVLGGGMSSRLFREIRESRGLAYAVHSFRSPFADSGSNAVYVGTTPDQTSEVLKLVRAEFDKMMDGGITEEELARARGHVQGSLAISLEDADSRMNRLGSNEITGLEHLSVDEIVARVDAVTLDDVLEAAGAAYAGPYVLGATGPFDVEDLSEFVR
ncbi:MAG: pitrilysin family protein [Acidimicrobiia bacterium]|nr:MAG: pitrilysin family protein [Acidimicrobiia bacterium]